MSVCNEVDSTYMFCCLNLILLRMGCCTCEWSELYFSASKNATSWAFMLRLGTATTSVRCHVCSAYRYENGDCPVRHRIGNEMCNHWIRKDSVRRAYVFLAVHE